MTVSLMLLTISCKKKKGEREREIFLMMPDFYSVEDSTKVYTKTEIGWFMSDGLSQ
jgi:hypothetical protein